MLLRETQLYNTPALNYCHFLNMNSRHFIKQELQGRRSGYCTGRIEANLKRDIADAA
jgi:hypothetical protein